MDVSTVKWVECFSGGDSNSGAPLPVLINMGEARRLLFMADKNI